MKKRILVLLTLAVAVFSMFACTPESTAQTTSPTTVATTATVTAEVTTVAPPSAEDISTPYFWKVTGNGYEGEFYLLGSIHVGDDYTNFYPEEITSAFNSCDYLAVESDIIAFEGDYALQTEAVSALMYLDGSTVTDHVDAEIYEAAKEIIKDGGYYSSTLDYLSPMYWVSLIDNIYIEKTPYTADKGVDRYFLQKAKDGDKAILEIENLIETYEALVSISEEAQEIILKNSVDDEYLEEFLEGTDDLYALWKKGDITGFEYLMDGSETEGMTDEELKAYEEYNKMLMTDRNENMVEVADSYLKSGKKVFYVVGLAHMLERDNIIDGLRDLGYTVTQIEYK